MARSGRRKSAFLLCVDPGPHEDLQVRRLYEVLPDESAARSNYVRVVNDSGEDYLYPASHFVTVDLPQAVLKALAQRKHCERRRHGGGSREARSA